MIFFFILLTAAILRFFNLPQTTEFFGDQGMDGLLILDALEKKTIPLVGPLSSQGIHQGVTYLYLLTPSLLIFRFDPLGSAYLMAVLGIIYVAIFYLLSQKLYGKFPALIATAVLAVSPIAIVQSRIYWNSFLLPIATVIILFCFVKVQETKKLPWFLLFGFTLGFTAQFHYSGLLLLLFAFLLFLTLKPWHYPRYSALTLVALTIPYIPFILYQLQNSFVDIKGLINYLSPFKNVYQTSPPPNLPTLFAIFFQNLFPKTNLLISGIVAAVMLVLPFIFKTAKFWHVFFSFFLLIALFIVSRNKGDFQIHYVDVLLPIPFLLLASFLNSLVAIRNGKLLVFLLAAVVIAINVLSLDTFKKPEDKLGKAQAMVDNMIMLAENKPFSFTIKSPSFSDSHYRYLLKIKNVTPRPIVGTDYERLFIACEHPNCPNEGVISGERAFPITCFDLHCKLEYPTIDLTKFGLAKTLEIKGGKLYRFDRSR